ncbi:DMT family transporter [Muribaculum gordoncarteri]|jgi:drug/metabolite transporter (DMT)-like permease|uniref:DMT family transporter n=9 Tax=Muribaculum TaxID=1918540 RepID=A0A4P7VMX0_9BACT|nr:DMT family transporter [Muribaculum gordoncarteri]QCD35121.1 DMT family transporter [Muribaculum gordoncarteri]
MSVNLRANQSKALWYHLGALLTVTAWGVSFVSTKVLLEHGINPTEVYVVRTLLAYLLVLCVCHKRIFSNSLRDELLFVSCGLCAGSLYFIAENTALEYTLVSNVSLIVTLSPLITTLLVGAIYKNERPGKGVLMGSLIAFLGVGCVIFNSSFVLDVKPLGDLLSLSAAVCWSVYSLVLRKLSAFYTVMFISRKTFFYGMVTAIPFLIAIPEHTPLDVYLQFDVWSNFLFLGVFCSMIAFIIWAFTIKGLGAIKANNYLYIQPIITLIASALLLGEKVSIVGYVGCSLILLGVWISDRMSRCR